MTVAINFYAGSDFTINALAGSGLGFYGLSFGQSVDVGAWQSKTFITDANGVIQGPEADNCKYANSTGVYVGSSGTPILLTQVPNYQSTLTVEFSSSTPVKTQNCQLRIYNRSVITTPPTGVTTAVAEIRHTGQTQTNNGSGDSTWTMFPGTTPTGAKTLTASPGSGGFRPSGSNTVDTLHHTYLAISQSPDQIGSLLSGLWFSCEYL